MVAVLETFWRSIGHVPNRWAQSALFRSGVLQKPKNVDYSVDWRGLRYNGNLRFLIDRHIYFAGGYSLNEIAFLSRASQIIRALKGSVVMLDIGANVGQHSLALYSEVDRIFAFEPNPETAARFRLNIAGNGIQNIELHEVALGDSDEIAVLGSGLEGNYGSRSLNWSLNSSSDIRVEVKAAGRYLSEIISAGMSVGLLKIDVEGHEAKVLSSLSDLLARDRPAILFELVGKEIKGGFASEASLRLTLYSDHRLYGLERGRSVSLAAFDWQRHEEAVCIPAELTTQFENEFVRIMSNKQP
jgi:FkbM family methyltransferase